MKSNILKIAITGHTEGIGKEIYEYFDSKGDNLKGFARANGYDLSVDYQKVIDEIIEWDADIVYNNAWSYGNQGQLEILKALHEHWKDKNKSIINTGSASGYAKNKVGNDVYANDKEALSEYAKKSAMLWPHKNKCKVQNVSFGYVQTKFLKGVHNFENYIPVEAAARILIDLYYDRKRPYVIAEQLVTHQMTSNEEHENLKKIVTTNVTESVLKSYV